MYYNSLKLLMSKTNKTNDKVIIKKYNKLFSLSLELKKSLFGSHQYCIKNVNKLIKNIHYRNYMFGQPIISNVSTLNDLTNERSYRKKIVNICIEKKYIDNVLEELINVWKLYIVLYEKYRKYRKTYVKCRKFFYEHRKILKLKCQHPLAIAKSSSGERTVMDNLEVLRDKYYDNLFYFYGHEFSFCNNASLNPFEFDFYCVLIHDDNLIQFVIEVDGEQHFEEKFDRSMKDQHISDVFKQFCLSQLNIHLLRISDPDKSYEQIKKFIKIIIDTNKYICVNGIEPDKSILSSKKRYCGLIDFCKYHTDQYNKLIIDLDKKKRVVEYESGEEQEVLDDYSPDGTDYVVTKDVFDKILKNVCYV